MSNEHIARAIVYAARQAFMINNYGMTWEAIEVNTANILAGCSVPADGKMNSAEAVQASIMERLRTQADTGRYTSPLVEPVSPGSPEMRVALALVDNYHAVKQELARTKEALRIESVAAMEARQEALANKVERDDFAAKWATLKGECHAQNQRANQAEKDNAELLRLLQETREAREMDVTSLERDRDGFRKGAQHWMDLANERARECNRSRDELHAQASKVVKLRTFLERKWCNVCSCDTEAINTILEETK